MDSWEWVRIEAQNDVCEDESEPKDEEEMTVPDGEADPVEPEEADVPTVDDTGNL
jgi:hypothetical protein